MQHCRERRLGNTSRDFSVASKSFLNFSSLLTTTSKQQQCCILLSTCNTAERVTERCEKKTWLRVVSLILCSSPRPVSFNYLWLSPISGHSVWEDNYLALAFFIPCKVECLSISDCLSRAESHFPPHSDGSTINFPPRVHKES